MTPLRKCFRRASNRGDPFFIHRSAFFILNFSFLILNSFESRLAQRGNVTL
jgi:hypothetical protein